MNPIVLDPHEVTRVWNLALALAAADESGEGDLAAAFPQALDTWVQFREHIRAGGVQIDDGERTWTSTWRGDNLVLTPEAKTAPTRKAAKKQLT